MDRQLPPGTRPSAGSCLLLPPSVGQHLQLQHREIQRLRDLVIFENNRFLAAQKANQRLTRDLNKHKRRIAELEVQLKGIRLKRGGKEQAEKQLDQQLPQEKTAFLPAIGSRVEVW